MSNRYNNSDKGKGKGKALMKEEVEVSKESAATKEVFETHQEGAKKHKYLDRDLSNVLQEYAVIKAAINWLGTDVTKELNGVKQVGCVLEVDHAKALFTVYYRDGSSEELSRNELEKLVDPRLVFSRYLDQLKTTRLNPENLRAIMQEQDEEEEEEEGEEQEEELVAPTEESCLQEEQAGVKGKRVMDEKEGDEPEMKKVRSKRKKAESSSNYVPLAFRERKKDDYYWYQ